MKILVLGWFFSSNLGDAVLTECTAWLLRQRFPRAQLVIRDLIGREQFPCPSDIAVSELHHRRRRGQLRKAAAMLGWDKQLSHELWRLNAAKDRLPQVTAGDFDAAVFAGGQLFMDSIGLFVEAAAAQLEARGIPVFFNACGTGPSCSPTIRRRLARTLTAKNVRWVSCRDDAALVNRWCGRELAVPVSDPALWAAAVYRIQKNPLADRVGLGIMYADSLNPRTILRFWRRLIRRMERDQTPWKLFTNGSDDDVAFARHLLASMPELSGPEEQYLCPAPRRPEELVQLISGFRSLISFRLHSHIIACSLDIPTVAIAWDRKLPFFAQKIGCPERCLTVNAAPEQVLTALARAEQTGYDRNAIQIQRELSATKLWQAMAPALQNEETHHEQNH